MLTEKEKKIPVWILSVTYMPHMKEDFNAIIEKVKALKTLEDTLNENS